MLGYFEGIGQKTGTIKEERTHGLATGAAALGTEGVAIDRGGSGFGSHVAIIPLLAGKVKPQAAQRVCGQSRP